MTQRGQPTDSSRLEACVAASFLGNGLDTRLERYVQEAADRTPERTLPEGLLRELGRALGIAPERIAEATALAREALEKAGRLALRVIDRTSPAYPEGLRQIVDPPIVLWVKGDVATLLATQVAVVGARAATPAGLAVARQLGQDLASAGLVVVSGLARGIDGAAHAGALAAGGQSVAVVGCGADIVYPSEHRALAARIADAGAIVSELAPGAPPLPHHFPRRNRIISGLARAVVVVEASDHSGSLITARAALDQGRDVLAVPGGVLSGRSRGCHALIRDGARLVDSVQDVLDEIGWIPAAATEPDGSKSLQTSQLEETMAAGESYSLDDLASRTGRSAGDLLSELGELELAGRITRLAGGGFMRT